MIEQLVNFVIRPPRRDDYNPYEELLPGEFSLKGRRYQRKDLEVTNKRGHVLQCSHYLPQNMPDGIQLPCVIYCHGNSGCRADANEAAVILLPSNITVFTLDFSGSGLSGGEYVSLGCNEMEDLKAVVTHLRSEKNVSRIGVWGRSMGAVTCLMYGAQDPSLAGMVLDSPFANLFDLMMELVEVYKIRLPKFTVKVAVQYMRKVIQKKAGFDIMDLDSVQELRGSDVEQFDFYFLDIDTAWKVAIKSFIPALFGHATEDAFIQPHHSDRLFEAYAGDKNIIKFEGDHNSPRPQFYYDSITIFFYNVLRPPDDPVAPEDFEGFRDDDLDESILYQILNAEREAQGPHPTPTSAPSGHREFAESTEEALNQTRSRWQMSRTVVPVNTSTSQDDLSELFTGDLSLEEFDGSSSCGHLENGDHGNYHDDFARCRSPKDYSGSWGRRSSNGSALVSPHAEDGFAQFPSNHDDEERMVLEAIAASLQDLEVNDSDRKDTTESSSPTGEDSSATSRSDSFTQRLRHGFFRSIGSRKSTSR